MLPKAIFETFDKQSESNQKHLMGSATKNVKQTTQLSEARNIKKQDKIKQQQ